MKIKIDYITNSSSSSFIIARHKISETQLVLIKEHIEVASMLTKLDPDLNFGWFDSWQISINEDTVEGSTSMDNFDMLAFLNVIGISSEDIEYDHY